MPEIIKFTIIPLTGFYEPNTLIPKTVIPLIFVTLAETYFPVIFFSLICTLGLKFIEGFVEYTLDTAKSIVDNSGLPLANALSVK